MTKQERILLMRQAGNIERCHLIPHLKEYTDAYHQYNCTILLLELYPFEPSKNLLCATLTHDCGEIFIGDTPRSAKWFWPDFGKILLQIETDIDKEFGFGESKYSLTKIEQYWLKQIDILELWLWCQDEIYGWNNQHAVEVLDNINENWTNDKRPLEINEFINEFNKIGWQRINPRKFLKEIK